MGTVIKLTSYSCRFSDDDEVDDGDDHLDEYTKAEGKGDEDDEPGDAKKNPSAHTDAMVGVLLRCNNFITATMMRRRMMMMRRRWRIMSMVSLVQQ